MIRHHHHFTDQDMQIVQAKILNTPIEDIAKEIGVKMWTLRKYISKWRGEGHAIPYVVPGRKRYSLGYTCKRIRKGKERQFIKTGSGWKIMPEKNEKPTGGSATNMKAPIALQNPRKCFKTKNLQDELSDLMPVRLGPRTVAFLRPGYDINAVRAMYGRSVI